jgi:hypothetical protein
MLQTTNSTPLPLARPLHLPQAGEEKRGTMLRIFSVPMALAALTLSACGDVSVDEVKNKAAEAAAGAGGDANALLNPERVAQILPPEAQGVVTSYTADLRGAAEAYKAEFGQLPASFADVASVAGAREAAVNVIADGLAEQVPFASRATVEQAANSVVTTAERQILDRMRTQDAPNP